MKKNTVDILGVPVATYTMREARDTIARQLKEGRESGEKKNPWLIATANAEMIMMATVNRALMDVLNSADLVVPDGAGTVWAAHELGYEMPERVAGYDLVQELLKIAPEEENGFKVFFFGSAPGVADAAKAKAESLYPGVQVVGCRNGFFTEADEPEIVKEINESGADLLLCALGVPKQEIWLQKHLPQLKISAAIGVGGTLDVMAGTVKRAPLWMQKAKLEWAYRGILQPSRIGRLMALPKFVLAVKKAKH
ncbi:MAG: WecB/TagA/CpsF family glycosyltransferase [Selenomonadaceae bacterium]|nr:WecB/TagA/CpsF family glycosyltransferase [Selenomonadaceae bacterium]